MGCAELKPIVCGAPAAHDLAPLVARALPSRTAIRGAVAVETAEGRRGGQWLQQAAELNTRDRLVEAISAFSMIGFCCA